MRLDSLWTELCEPLLTLFPTFSYTYMRLSAPIHLFFITKQSWVTVCPKLAVKKDALPLFLISVCHFIGEYQSPSLLIDAAEHHTYWLQSERPWGKSVYLACFYFNLKTIHTAHMSTECPSCVMVHYFTYILLIGGSGCTDVFQACSAKI